MNTTQTINAGVQTAMSAALHSANIENIVKASATAPKTASTMHTILVRRDVQGKPVVFLPDTFSKPDNKISYWAGDKNGTVQETTADYYFTSKPAEPELSKEMADKYSTRFHAKEILVRQRLYKENSSLRKSLPEKEGDEQAARKEFADKLVAAITKAVYSALES